MTSTSRPKSGKTTYHRDGTVTLWDVYAQQWIRGRSFSTRVLAACSHAEVDRIERHAERNAVRFRGIFFA